MPNKDKKQYNAYMKIYMKQKRIAQYNYRLVLQEFKQRAILPRHIYEFRIVMKQMLREYFHKRVIKIYNKTHIIIDSYLHF